MDAFYINATCNNVCDSDEECPFLSDIIQIISYFYSETLKSNDLGTQIQTRFGVPGKNCDFNI